MLIITPGEFVPEFDTLVEFYKYRGFKVKAYSTEHIDTVAAGQDGQEKPLAERDYALGEALNLLKGLSILGGGDT